MADQNQTVHTIFTGEANLEAARAELKSLNDQFQAVMKQMAAAVGAVDTRTLAMLRNYNKAMGTLQQAQRSLQGLAVQPDRMGARNRSDIKGEAASMAGDLLSYRKTVSKALAGTVLEIDEQIRKLNEAYNRLSTNRRKNAKSLAETQAEIDRLSKSRSTIASNPYVAGELTGARTERARANLRKAATDDRTAARAAEELAQAKLRLMTIESQLSGLDARNGGRAPARISALRQERDQLQTLVQQYEAVSSVMQKYNQSYARLTGNAMVKNDRQTVGDARAYLAAQERIAQAKQRIEMHEAGQLRLNAADLNQLRLEVQMSEKLLRLHEQDAVVMGRVADLQRRKNQQGQPADPQQRMGARADLMGDYAALGAASTAAYAVWDFAVKDESALAQFRAIASASGAETARLAKDMRELGQNSKYTNLQIAETATLLAQAGLSARDTGPALKAISELATAAGVELRQAADVTTSVANIWGYNVSQMGDIANVLTAALNQTKLGMDQIQLGIQYAGNTAVDAGVDFVELTSIMGGMAQAGIRSGSTIGTGLRTLLTDLQTPTEKTVETMQRLGLSLADVDVRSLGLTQVLQNLKAAGFTSADAMGAFEIRAAAAFSAISNNLGVITDLQGSLYDTTAASRANEIQMNTLSARWTSFSNAALGMGSTALAPIITLLKELLQFGASVAGVLNRMVPVIQGVTAAMVLMLSHFAITRLGLALGALGNIALGMRGVAVATTGAAAATATFGATLRAIPLMNLVSLGVGAITMLASMAGVFRSNSDEADLLNGAINDLNSEMAESETSIKAVDQAVGNLRQRYAELQNNEVIRGQVLAQTRQRFEALGLQIDKSSTSVDDMITALGRLRNELNKDFESQLLTLADRLQEKVDRIKKDLEDGEVVSEDRLRRVREAGFRQGTLGDPTTAFGDAGRRVYGLASGTLRMGRDVDEDQLRRDRQAFRYEERRVAELARTATPGSREARKWDQRLLDIKAYQYAIADILDHVTEIARLEAESVEADEQAAFRGMMANPRSAASRMSAMMDTNLAPFGTRANEVYRSGADAEEIVRQAEILKDEADTIRFQTLEAIRNHIAVGGEGAAELAPYVDQLLEEIDTRARQTINRAFSHTQAYSEQAGREGRANGRVDQQNRNDDQDLERRLAAADKRALEARMELLEADIDRLVDTGVGAAEIQVKFEEWKRLNGLVTAASVSERQAQLQASAMYDRRSGLAMPVTGRVSSQFQSNRGGRPHQGMDIAVASGTRVSAAGTGRVVRTGNDAEGWGNFVEIEHANGLRTIYAHLSRIMVTAEQQLERGAQIGLSGGGPNDPGKGNSRGAHLHFETLRNGRAVDPRTVIGQGGAAAANDPALARLSALNVSEAQADGERRLAEMTRKVTEGIAETLFGEIEAALKTRRQSNNREMDAMVNGIEAAGDATTDLDAIADQLRTRISDNIEIARRLLEEDPDNANRLNSPLFRSQVEGEKLQEMLAGADKMQRAYEAFVNLQERLGSERIAETQNQLRIARGTAGTSETTTWLLNQRLELEQYQTALDVLRASEEAYTLAIAERAEAQLAVANATMALRAATTEGNADAIAMANEALRLAEATLMRVRQTAAAAGVQVQAAQNGVTAATPVGPISDLASTATASGPSGAMDHLRAAIDRYKKESGVMVDISQTVADGIYGAFSKLGAGIEATINQIADGSITIQGAFENIFKGILEEMKSMAAKIAANWIMQYVLKMAMNAMGVPTVALPGAGATPNPGGISIGGAGPYKHGGEVKRRALGGGGQYGRDSVNILAEPGEVVMRKSAVDFLGRDNLLSMNAMGNRKLAGAQARIPALPQREPDKVNVWVVDRTQVPPPSKKDIIHMIGESMVNGELKKLVKTVAVGG